MKNVKGAATTGTRSTHASSSKVSSRYPSTRSSVPLEPIPHSRIHRVYLLAFLTRRFFRRSCPDASFYFLTSRRSPRPSTALFVADYSFREFFIRVYSTILFRQTNRSNKWSSFCDNPTRANFKKIFTRNFAVSQNSWSRKYQVSVSIISTEENSIVFKLHF